VLPIFFRYLFSLVTASVLVSLRTTRGQLAVAESTCGVAVVLRLMVSGVALVATTGLLLMAWVWGSAWILGWV
jgi:hypothetical protein